MSERARMERLSSTSWRFLRGGSLLREVIVSASQPTPGTVRFDSELKLRWHSRILWRFAWSESRSVTPIGDASIVTICLVRSTLPGVRLIPRVLLHLPAAKSLRRLAQVLDRLPDETRRIERLGQLAARGIKMPAEAIEAAHDVFDRYEDPEKLEPTSIG